MRRSVQAWTSQRGEGTHALKTSQTSDEVEGCTPRGTLCESTTNCKGAKTLWSAIGLMRSRREERDKRTKRSDC